MKTLYIVIIWLAMFQGITLMIAGLGVFPADSQLYSDFEINELEENADSPVDMLSYIFLPSGEEIGGTTGNEMITSGILVGAILIILGIGSVVAVFTKNYTSAVLIIVGISFVPMISKSWGFFNKLFVHWDTSAMTYMGVTLGLGVFILFLLLIVEMPTHGDS